MNKLESALALAALGLPVFPVGAQSRKPVISDFPSKATTSPKPIADWWAKHPAHNIAVATGLNGGPGYLAVLDIDRHGKDGFAALKAWEDAHGKLPETFAVSTPRGGLHLYFFTPQPLRCSQSKVGEGLDIRGYHGYVVAPGSFHQELAKAYRISNDAPVARAPEALVEAAGVYSERELRAASVAPTDDESAIARAIDYLQTAADRAISGDGGDLATYRVAARLKDLGLSQPTVFALMRDHWNDDQSPPWPLAELEQKSFNAFRYGVKPVSDDNPEADFEEFDDSQPFGEKQLARAGLPVGAYEEAPITPRQWVAGKAAMRGHITVIVAPPGVGKSTFTIALALACASGRSLLGPRFAPAGKTPTLLWNSEDDTSEIQRRIKAARIHFGVDAKELLTDDHRPSLFLKTDDSRPLTILRRNGKTLQPVDAHLLSKAILDANAGLVIIDPFAETHQASENDNGEMLEVLKLFRAIAVKTNAAIILVHHSKKPPMASSESYAGDMNTGRGASSVIGAARIMFTLYGMSRKDARALGIPEENKHLYVRLDDAKSNHSLTTGAPQWFRKVSVPVPAPTLSDPLFSESTGVLNPIDLQPVEEDKTDLKLLALDLNELVETRLQLRSALTELRKIDRYRTHNKDLSRDARAAIALFGEKLKMRLEKFANDRWMLIRV